MAYRAAAGDRRINAASFNVMPLDFDTEARIGALHSKPLIDVRPERHGERDLAHRYIVVHEFVDLVAASRVKRSGEKERLHLCRGLDVVRQQIVDRLAADESAPPRPFDGLLRRRDHEKTIDEPAPLVRRQQLPMFLRIGGEAVETEAVDQQCGVA